LVIRLGERGAAAALSPAGLRSPDFAAGSAMEK
jgi:hypothetical protein